MTSITGKALRDAFRAAGWIPGNELDAARFTLDLDLYEIVSLAEAREAHKKGTPLLFWNWSFASIHPVTPASMGINTCLCAVRRRGENFVGFNAADFGFDV